MQLTAAAVIVVVFAHFKPLLLLFSTITFEIHLFLYFFAGFLIRFFDCLYFFIYFFDLEFFLYFVLW